MFKKTTIFYAILVLMVTISISGVALAAKPVKLAVTVNPSQGKVQVTIPPQAVEKAHGVFSLGTAIDHGRVVEGYAIVRYKDDYVKPGTSCGDGTCDPGENVNKCPEDCGGGTVEPDTSSCYAFLAKNAKWKTEEPYFINPTNTKGLDENTLVTNFADDILKWEDAAQYNILGDGSVSTETLEADLNSPDDQNEVYFGDISEHNAIAITIVWGIFGGRPSARELVEWDQVYDQVDFDWSLSGEAGKMDFDNIATHELGHSVGLADLYSDVCSEQTMYGYASEGETIKQTLEDGDIAGIQKLY